MDNYDESASMSEDDLVALWEKVERVFVHSDSCCSAHPGQQTCPEGCEADRVRFYLRTDTNPRPDAIGKPPQMTPYMVRRMAEDETLRASIYEQEDEPEDG